MSWGPRWTEMEWLEHAAKQKINPSSAIQTPHMEPATSDEPVGKKKSPALAPRFRVKVHTKGKRLGDCDGRSVKAVFDAFTKAGIWADDKCVAEVVFTQEIAEEDQTVIEVWEI